VLLKIVYPLTCRVPGMAVLVFRGDRWRWGRGGWGGFIPHVGPGQGLWHAGGVEVDAGLAGGSRGAMREQPGDDLDRHAAADQPGRSSIPGSVACVIAASRG
jgi:hypothetical protein